ncbi:kinesin light chain [Aspergillus terreus]|uniref:Kinesin light chain n=1 Tax=Aspergillus terreus TaxID=33178 RepID=A0A5M3Z8Q8_ASPTE|nr:hypothetical protein ATETN484_0011048900 [Aspergillus terreus]GFF19131.1 kinesin light chain [Aspergillus terreus]
MRPKSRSDFTVAIICALPIEAEAVEELFDETYDTLSQFYGKQQGDDNTYTTGRMGKHHVVLCYMPGMGKRNAASVVSSLKMSYTRIEIALAVGICGGVPFPRNKPPIFLGDVIVSDAVIEYDFGRQHPGGFQRKNGVKETLGQPNREIRSFLLGLRTKRTRGEFWDRVVGYVQGLQLRDQKWVYPGKTLDVLCEPSHRHKHHGPGGRRTCSCMRKNLANSVCTEALETDCTVLGCVGTGVSHDRPDGEDTRPSVHIGTIASADMGVSDYADSHKDKRWQAYAAAAGAAGAKTFLEYWRPAFRDLMTSSCWLVPFARNPRFTGRREEVKKLEDMIFKVHGPQKIAIAGLGGIGKTQIALELAYRVRDRDSQYSVFWVPCTSIATVEQAYMSIAQMLGVHGTSPSETKERLKLYLSQPSAGKWLLIFDNADESDMWLPEPGPRESIPQSEHGRVIFTSRNEKLAVTLASPHIVQLSGLDERTAMSILNESLVQKQLLNDRKATVDLLSQLAFLPLAIVQAANYINQNNISLGDYLELLQEHESEVVTLLSENFGDDWRYQDMQNPVATTWLISFQQIQRMDPLAAEYLSVMGCLHPRDIPQSLLPAAPSKKRELEAIGLLKAYSFISVSGRSDDACFNLHRLVYLAIRNWLRLNQQMEPYIFRTAGILAERFPTYAAANRPLWRQYLPHALSLIAEKDFREKRQWFLLLLQNIGQCLVSDGRHNEADAIFYDIMTISTDLWGVDHPYTIMIMSWVSYVYQYQQRTSEAEQLQMHILETYQRTLGPEHLETISCLGTLATIYHLQGRLKEAEKMQKQALDRYTQALGPTHLGTLYLMEGLAKIYSAQGRWKEAAALAKEVLTARRRALGPEGWGTLEAMLSLAFVYHFQGRARRAEKLVIRVLKAKQHILGDEYPDIMNCLGELANVHHTLGRWKKSVKLTTKVVEMSTRLLGPRHPLTLSYLDSLGVSYAWRYRWTAAERLHVEVMELRKQMLGPEHPDTLHSMKNVALAWNGLCRSDDAVALMTECVRLRRQVLGPDHPDTIASMRYLRLCEAQRLHPKLV